MPPIRVRVRVRDRVRIRVRIRVRCNVVLRMPHDDESRVLV